MGAVRRPSGATAPLIRHFSRRWRRWRQRGSSSSSPAVSTHLRRRRLSVLVHICVRLSWWKSVLVRSFVRSPFLLVFRLYLFLIARSSSSFLLRSISFSLFPFFAPYVIIGSLGPSEAGAGAGADTAVSTVVPEDALDAAIHDVCVFRHYQVNADADRKFECAVRNEIGESLKLDYFGENAERENDGRGGVGPRLALVRFISSEESGQREPTAWPQSAKSARNSRFLSLLRELPICRDVIPQRQRGRRTTTNVISLLGSDGESGKSAGARKPLKAS